LNAVRDFALQSMGRVVESTGITQALPRKYIRQQHGAPTYGSAHDLFCYNSTC
jgi:hypothetical protein